LVWYRKAAETGSAYAVNNLGAMYHNGWAVPKSDADAVAWYRKAAEAGNAPAMNNLGAMYHNGRGVSKSDTDALVWYRKAAQAGNTSGMNNLGAMYHNGWAVPKSDADAVAWYRKAAEAGNAYAMYNLGLMLRKALGVTSDEREAMRWFSKCAELGSANCAEQLGRGYFDGLGGGQRDYVLAAAWFTKAAKQNNPWAQVYLGIQYQNGWGVQKSADTAKSLYARAAKSDEAVAAHTAMELSNRLQQSRSAKGAQVAPRVIALIGSLESDSSRPSSGSSIEKEDEEWVRYSSACAGENLWETDYKGNPCP
jgi:TPR repeat protein